ncbi:MAG: hypothetical protein KDD11_15320, partial [Acidobacteria bacterium]|nr:hypothetical protein [Acidobacteriota bacterium]
MALRPSALALWALALSALLVTSACAGRKAPLASPTDSAATATAHPDPAPSEAAAPPAEQGPVGSEPAAVSEPSREPAAPEDSQALAEAKQPKEADKP